MLASSYKNNNRIDQEGRSDEECNLFFNIRDREKDRRSFPGKKS